ncbi:MAG: HAD family phosphatase [bacterium]
MDIIKGNVKAIIFDMDGTILKTEHIWNQVSREVLTHCGIATLSQESEVLLDSLSGSSLLKAATLMKDVFKLPQTEEEILDLHIKLSNKLFEERCEFIEGFEEFHKQISSYAIPSSIATNAHHDNLKGIVKVMSLDSFFGENIYSPIHVNNKFKPDPALFLHAAKMLNVNPAECVVFEDSVYGFQAANAAGMKCIAIKNKLNAPQLENYQLHNAIETYHDALEALRKV